MNKNTEAKEEFEKWLIETYGDLIRHWDKDTRNAYERTWLSCWTNHVEPLKKIETAYKYITTYRKTSVPKEIDMLKKQGFLTSGYIIPCDIGRGKIYKINLPDLILALLKHKESGETWAESCHELSDKHSSQTDQLFKVQEENKALKEQLVETREVVANYLNTKCYEKQDLESLRELINKKNLETTKSSK